MIEYWGYFIGFGGVLVAIGSLLQKILTDNDTYESEFQRLKAIFKTNYYQKLIDAIKTKIESNLPGLTDAEINSEIDSLFIIVSFFQKSELLNGYRKNRANQFQVALIVFGVTIALYPWIQPMESILIAYYVIVAVLLILTLGILGDRIYKTKRRDNVINQLSLRITLGPNETEGTPQEAD